MKLSHAILISALFGYVFLPLGYDMIMADALNKKTGYRKKGHYSDKGFQDQITKPTTPKATPIPSPYYPYGAAAPFKAPAVEKV